MRAVIVCLALSLGGCCLFHDSADDLERDEDPFIREHEQRGREHDAVERRLRQPRQERAQDPD